MVTSQSVFGMRVGHKVHATPLSRSATVAALVSAHEHDWQFFARDYGHALRYPVSDEELASISPKIAALLAQHHRAWQVHGDDSAVGFVAGDEKVAATLDRIHASLGAAESSRILEAVLNPETARHAQRALIGGLDAFPLGTASFRLWHDKFWSRMQRYRGLR